MRHSQTIKPYVAPKQDALSSFVTTKLMTFPEGTGEYDAVEEDERLELADDAELTMQLRAVHHGRRATLAAIAASVIALGTGIALVL